MADPDIVASLQELHSYLHHEGQIAALLHLQAVGLVLTAAYIGFDRIHAERDQLQEILGSMTEKVGVLVEQMDIRGEGLEVKKIFQTFNIFVLCHVAKIKVRLGVWKRPLHIVHRQWYIPLLEYFRSGLHLWVVGAMCVVISGMFFWTVGLAAYGDDVELTPGFILVSYRVVTACIIWIFITAALSYRLRTLEVTCNKLCRDTEKLVNDMVKEVWKNFPGGQAQPLDARVAENPGERWINWRIEPEDD